MVSLSDFAVAASIPVSDMDRARRFYEGRLGLRPEPSTEGHQSYLCAGGTRLHLYLSLESAGSCKATLTGFAVDDLDRVVDELSARGVRFEQYHQPGLETNVKGVADFAGGGRVAYFKDPDGNIHSLAQAT